MTTTIAEKPRNASIELRHGASWVRLAICLAEPFVGGSITRLAQDARVELEGDDELSSCYANANWLSGVASGAFYAYRALNAPRRVVLVTDLAGRLGASDIQVLAYAAARMIAGLLNRELNLADVDGWQVAANAISNNGLKSN